MMAATKSESTMTLQNLLPECDCGEFATLAVGPLKLDSRQIQTGDTFVALQGTKVNGEAYISSSIEQGASLVLKAAPSYAIHEIEKGVVELQLPNLAARLSEVAGRWYGLPSKHMKVFAITGTNGKTTCSQWLAQLLHSQEIPAASLGTLGFGLEGDELVETGLTTPDAITTQSICADLHARGAKVLVMEASSHSLEQNRVADIDIDVAVFTNIGRDHLDYHGDIQSYVAAKTELMKFTSLSAAVVNTDDEYSTAFIDALSDSVTLITYGVSANADLRAKNIRYLAEGVEFDLSFNGEIKQVSLPILGAFNVSNLMAVVAAAVAGGMEFAAAVEKLCELKSVPGRLQPVEAKSDIHVLVDFAHTADALESALNAIRAHSERTLWSVFGCGGDRDAGKRPLMARVAEQLADRVVVTSDNPRTENPEVILDDVMAGFKCADNVIRLTDRKEAIEFAVDNAGAGDCVLIAGKGHEDYQLIGTEKFHFSDLEVASEALEKRAQSLKSDRGKAS